MTQFTAIARKYATGAGWRSTVRSRETGLPVSVYDGEAQGLDTEGGRWYTICEPHGYAVGHRTLRLAFWHQASPLTWCERCNGADTSDC